MHFKHSDYRFFCILILEFSLKKYKLLKLSTVRNELEKKSSSLPEDFFFINSIAYLVLNGCDRVYQFIER